MYFPILDSKPNGIPIASGEDLDGIGESFVMDFQPQALRNPQPVRIESFTELYLGMNCDYQYLTHNGVYLGMTVFNKSDRVPIYDPITKRAEYISEEANTIIIDNRLLRPDMRPRYIFTLAHECGHAVLHKEYFARKAARDSSQPLLACRVDSSATEYSHHRPWTDRDWMEWQANKFASSLLMPRKSVQELVRIVQSRMGSLPQRSMQYLLVKEVAETFQVSVQAAVYRLVGLGYVPKEMWHRYA